MESPGKDQINTVRASLSMTYNLHYVVIHYDTVDTVYCVLLDVLLNFQPLSTTRDVIQCYMT